MPARANATVAWRRSRTAAAMSPGPGGRILDDVAVAVLTSQPDAERGGERRLHHPAVG
jgi:hypothetical protein